MPFPDSFFVRRKSSSCYKFILDQLYGNNPFIFGLSRKAIKVAAYYLTKREYNVTRNEIVSIYYFMHLHQNVQMAQYYPTGELKKKCGYPDFSSSNLTLIDSMDQST